MFVCEIVEFVHTEQGVFVYTPCTETQLRDLREYVRLCRCGSALV